MTPAPRCRVYWSPGCPVNRCRTSWRSGCSSRWAWPILASTCQLASAIGWLAFGRMLLAGGVSASGRRLLSADSVRLMTTDHTTPAQREIGALFLEGQGWGFGGSVDIAAIDPWNVPGRYGWVGGTGTSAHITPSTGTVAILLTQVAADSPVPPDWMRDFWRYAASAA
jgi:CubicO group peptidase (beta-lactamase class C family)